MGKIQGVVTGRVVNVVDPDHQGRVQVSLPYLGGQNTSYWAPVATMMSGKGRGSWFMPEVGDEVLIAFNQDDVAHPFIVGFLWNGEDTPPSNDRHLRVDSFCEWARTATVRSAHPRRRPGSHSAAVRARERNHEHR